MTREDLLKGNCEIAEQLGKDIKTYCPDVKHVVIIFNPADLTGLVTLLLQRFEAFAGYYARCSRLYAFAERFGQEVWRYAERSEGLRYLWWSRRTDGCVRQQGYHRWPQAQRLDWYARIHRRRMGTDAS